MRIHIATDHAGLDFSTHLKQHLAEQGTRSSTTGRSTTTRSTTTRRSASTRRRPSSRDQEAGVEALGVVFGGSGNGEQIAANKVRGIRAALVWNIATAELARQHNDANVISIGARQHTIEEATDVHRRASSPTPFSYEERHVRRIGQIARVRGAPAPSRATRPDVLAPTTARSTPRPAEPPCPRVTPSTASRGSSSATSSGRRVAVSSPQGRFAEGASLHRRPHDDRAVRAVGKQMFLEFDNELWLRVHLGMYGAWDFAGEILVDPTIASANGRMGQTNQRGTVLRCRRADLDAAGENSLHIDRCAAAHPAAHGGVGEATGSKTTSTTCRREPIGQVRVRLLTDDGVSPTCAVRPRARCRRPTQVDAMIAKLGPDPLVDDASRPRSASSRPCARSRRRSRCC